VEMWRRYDDEFLSNLVGFPISLAGFAPFNHLPCFDLPTSSRSATAFGPAMAAWHYISGWISSSRRCQGCGGSGSHGADERTSPRGCRVLTVGLVERRRRTRCSAVGVRNSGGGLSGEQCNRIPVRRCRRSASNESLQRAGLAVSHRVCRDCAAARESWRTR
jgi:hypothetical protein